MLITSMKKEINIKNKFSKQSFFYLIQDIKNVIKKARYNAFTAVNTEMLKAYFEIGRKIIEEEQKGNRSQFVAP